MSRRGTDGSILLRGAGIGTGRGAVLADVDAQTASGGLLVVRGPARSGRTCLLLALSGRMALDAGDAVVAGHRLPQDAAAVRGAAALAPMTGVNDLDEALTVGEHVAERLLVHQPWWQAWTRRRDVEAALAGLPVLAGLEARRPVADLAPLERFRLGLGLALVGRPAVLVVDDVDAMRQHDDRRAAWADLAGLDRDVDGVAVPAAVPASVTVVASCQEDGELADVLADGGPVRAVSTVDLAPAVPTA